MPTTLLRDKHIEYILSLQDVRFHLAAAGPFSTFYTRGSSLGLVVFCMPELLWPVWLGAESAL